MSRSRRVPAPRVERARYPRTPHRLDLVSVFIVLESFILIAFIAFVVLLAVFIICQGPQGEPFCGECVVTVEVNVNRGPYLLRLPRLGAAAFWRRGARWGDLHA